MTLDIQKEKLAIERLKIFTPIGEPYWLCYSGGKDSDVIRILAKLAGVPHEVHHNLTTVDAPETIQYIKSIPDVIIDKAHYKDGRAKTMWNIIPKHMMPPTRLIRYCCEELKERGGDGRMKITGVRYAESTNRKKNGGVVRIIGRPKHTQKMLTLRGIQYRVNPQGGVVMGFDNESLRNDADAVHYCYKKTNTTLNPIVEWTDSDVWEFLHHYGCEGNPLYQCGSTRIGCIGCPMASRENRLNEFRRYPKYEQNYLRAFDKMLQERERKGKETSVGWATPEDVMAWWLRDPEWMARHKK